MFSINKNTELDAKLLQKMLNAFVVDVQPNLEKNKRYYDGLQAILNKKYSDTSKVCNKVITNYCKDIADSYCGYLATPGYITYKSEEDIEEIMNVLKYNDYQSEDNDFLLQALTYGTAAELMFIDDDAKTRFKLINPTQCFGIYDSNLTGDLLYFVRFYLKDEWNESDVYNLDVYSNSDIKHYEMTGLSGNINFISEEPHYFNQCPANLFSLPDEKSIFDCILSLQDAYNELLSSEIDDFSAFCDAYLELIGVDADEEDIAKMKANRVLILPEGAEAKYLTKNTTDAQSENILKRIHDSVYRIAACPDFSSETFVGGVSSGIAIRYRLTGMETRAGKIQAEMKKALQRRIEILCGIATLKLGENIWVNIDINFKRNIPIDINSIINIVNSLKGTVSDATLLSQLPFVNDVQKELEALEEQKKKNMETFGFPLHTETKAEDEEEE